MNCYKIKMEGHYKDTFVIAENIPGAVRNYADHYPESTIKEVGDALPYRQPSAEDVLDKLLREQHQ